MTRTTKGIYHDLSGIYEKLNRAYFDGKINASIVWGKKGTNKTRSRSRSIRLGSYCDARKLITIHPAMDQACVPRLCVERIVHHEMLHQIHPVKKDSYGRRLIHTPSFRADEEQFDDAKAADYWFKANLDRILQMRTKVS